MPENSQEAPIDLNALLSLPPERVLGIIAFEISRRANSIDGFAIILTKEEFRQEHSHAIEEIERQAKITKSILNITWDYLEKRGYIDLTKSENT